VEVEAEVVVLEVVLLLEGVAVDQLLLEVVEVVFRLDQVVFLEVVEVEVVLLLELVLNLLLELEVVEVEL